MVRCRRKSISGSVVGSGPLRCRSPWKESVHARRRVGRSVAGRHRALDPFGAGTCGSRQSRSAAPFPSGGVSLPTAACGKWSRGGVTAAGTSLHTPVHVEVEGLWPGRDYFYQFDVRNEESPRRPLPYGAVGCMKSSLRLRFAFATCQEWPSGYYTAYRDMLDNDLDFVLHLGDYTYEYAIGGSQDEAFPFRMDWERRRSISVHIVCGTPSISSTPICRLHTRSSRLRSFGTITRSQNDYSGLAPVEGGSPASEFTAKRAAAYQAYYEHMPIRLAAARTPGRDLRIYRQLRYRQTRRVHAARRPPVPNRQSVRRQRIPSLQRGR